MHACNGKNALEYGIFRRKKSKIISGRA